MIEFNNSNNVIYNKELEKASENLPYKGTHIIGYVENEDKKGYSFFLIGKDESNFIKEQDFISLRDGDDAKTDYIIRDYGIEYFSEDYVDSFSIFFDEIPDYLQYIDLYLNNDSDDSFLSECTLRFQSEENSKEEDLFCYNFNTTMEHKNLFLGTFARVTDGWKFYPKFVEHSIDMKDILSVI